jgi:superfamily II DNA/RNA helicase
MAEFEEQNKQEMEPKVDETVEREDGISTNWDECTTTFDSMDLKEDLLRGIFAYGFEKPSAIQQVSGRSIIFGE